MMRLKDMRWCVENSGGRVIKLPTTDLEGTDLYVVRSPSVTMKFYWRRGCLREDGEFNLRQFRAVIRRFRGEVL